MFICCFAEDGDNKYQSIWCVQRTVEFFFRRPCCRRLLSAPSIKEKNEFLTFCRVPLLASLVFHSKFCSGPSLPESYKMKTPLINISCFALSRGIKIDNEKQKLTFLKRFIKLVRPKIIKIVWKGTGWKTFSVRIFAFSRVSGFSRYFFTWIAF